MTETKVERAQWESPVQYLMTCLCYSIGLGNIWRFPALAYEHGGGAFLIPYLLCSFVIGFPILFLEMSLGQFARAGPAVAFGRIRPLFQGVGWSMCAVSALVAVYYNVICAWIQLYLFAVLFQGGWNKWSSCQNSFNTIYCQSTLEDDRCAELSNANHELVFFFNGSCHFGRADGAFESRRDLYSVLSPMSPAEEFFENYVLEKSAGIEDLGGLNLKLLISLGIAWVITGLVLLRGVKIMGRIAWFTGSVPYLIVIILFFRGITLDGADIGMRYYLTEPDFSHIFRLETWRAAATQVCFTLAIGFGGLLSLSSFNKPNNNCYRAALIVTLADGVNSLFSGTAVFAVLGFMSKQLKRPISSVIQSGSGLVFIVFPEAISRMPLPWLWSFLYFFMLFLLGVASQFGMAEVMITAIYDQFPWSRPYKSYTSVLVCGLLFCAGIIMTTKAGIFYLNLFDSYSASFSLILLVILELILIVYIYGLDEYLLDIESMMGKAESQLGRVFGPSGFYIQVMWRYLAPLATSSVCGVILITQIASSMTYGKENRQYVYPDWAIGVGWIISLIPVVFLPAFVVHNVRKFKKRGEGWNELFKLQPKWTSYERVTRSELESAASGSSEGKHHATSPQI